jgi:hypothetical protein
LPRLSSVPVPPTRIDSTTYHARERDVMLAVSHRSFEALPTIPLRLDMEHSGTINPAALNAPGKHRPFPACSATRRRLPIPSPSSSSPVLMPLSLAAGNSLHPNLLSTSSPRGQKRSRSSDTEGTTGQEPGGGT